MKSDKKILERIKNAVHKVEPSATVILYGSRARGDNKLDSDWDILIISGQQGISLKKKNDIQLKIYEIELVNDIIITPTILKKEDWQTHHYIPPFIESVRRDAIIL